MLDIAKGWGGKAIAKTGHGLVHGKGVHQDCILSPCLLNFYAEYIMQNARMDDS